MREVGYLSQLHDRFFELGFRVLAVSSEPVDKIRSQVVEKRGATYWLASDPSMATSERFAAGQSRGIPHFYLVGSDGKVIRSGLPDPDELAELLLRPMWHLDRALAEELHGAQTAHQGWAFGAAWKQAQRLVDHDKPEVAADARLLVDKIEALDAFYRKLIGDVDEWKDPDIAYGVMVQLEHRFAGLPLSKWAADEARRLSRHERVKPFLKEWRAFDTAIRKEMLAVGNESKMRRARELYSDIAKRYPRSFVGRLAGYLAENAGIYRK